MPSITRDFPLAQLVDWDAPYADDTAIHATRDWCVFRAPDDGLTYRFEFSPAAAECDDMAWYDDLPRVVTAVRVELRQVTANGWTPVESEGGE